MLKKELIDIDNSNFYTTIKDKESEMYSGLSVQKATLGILSIHGETIINAVNSVVKNEETIGGMEILEIGSVKEAVYNYYKLLYYTKLR